MVKLEKRGGVAVVVSVARSSRDPTSMEHEGVALGCYRAYIGERAAKRSRVAVALDGSNIAGDIMTYAVALPSRPERPERTLWFPCKVFQGRGR